LARWVFGKLFSYTVAYSVAKLMSVCFRAALFGIGVVQLCFGISEHKRTHGDAVVSPTLENWSLFGQNF